MIQFSTANSTPPFPLGCFTEVSNCQISALKFLEHLREIWNKIESYLIIDLQICRHQACCIFFFTIFKMVESKTPQKIGTWHKLTACCLHPTKQFLESPCLRLCCYMMLPAGPWLGQNDTKCLRGMKIPSTLTYTLKSYGIALESIPPILHPTLHKVLLLHGGNLAWKSLDSGPFAILAPVPALWSPSSLKFPAVLDKTQRQYRTQNWPQQLIRTFWCSIGVQNGWYQNQFNLAFTCQFIHSITITWGRFDYVWLRSSWLHQVKENWYLKVRHRSFWTSKW